MIYAEENPANVTEVDVVVAIPTFNEVTSIANIVSQIDEGLRKHFRDSKSAIILCDNNSVDGTKETFLGTETKTPKLYISSGPNERGKGYNIQNLFEKISMLKPEAVAIFEADIRNINPDWVYYFLAPIMRGAGFVTPLYITHKYEATLSGILVYPFLRCLYGRRVRQSIAGDCAFGKNLVEKFAQKQYWSDLVSEKGIDLWMTITAIYERQPICQTIIGSPKIHRIKDPHAQINKAFIQIVGVLFDLMDPFQDLWLKVKWSKPTILFNAELQDAEVPIPIDVNVPRLFEFFSRGFENYKELLASVLSHVEIHKLEEIKNMGLQHFSFPSHTWSTILFDAAVAYRKADKEMKRNIIEALLPLYYGKVASYVRKTERMSTQQAEETIENECMSFEENKTYLINKWKVE